MNTTDVILGIVIIVVNVIVAIAFGLTWWTVLGIACGAFMLGLGAKGE